MMILKADATGTLHAGAKRINASLVPSALATPLASNDLIIELRVL